MEGLWSVMTVLGPILLGLALIYAMFRNRRDTRPGDEARSDRAAKALNDSLNREDKRREGEPVSRADA
jgi:hypothetical protein